MLGRFKARAPSRSLRDHKTLESLLDLKVIASQTVLFDSTSPGGERRLFSTNYTAHLETLLLEKEPIFLHLQ